MEEMYEDVKVEKYKLKKWYESITLWVVIFFSNILLLIIVKNSILLNVGYFVFGFFVRWLIVGGAVLLYFGSKKRGSTRGVLRNTIVVAMIIDTLFNICSLISAYNYNKKLEKYEKLKATIINVKRSYVPRKGIGQESIYIWYNFVYKGINYEGVRSYREYGKNNFVTLKVGDTLEILINPRNTSERWVEKKKVLYKYNRK